MHPIFHFCILAVLFQTSVAQDTQKSTDAQPSMKMPGMSDTEGTAMHMHATSLIEMLQSHTTAGTDAQPVSTPQEMLMGEKSTWTFMLHGDAFVADIQQSGPRGGDKFFSTNWIMPMAQRKFGNGTLTLRTMLSLEPATISKRRYPELFQQGETAFGKPIADGQHPHDLFMELAALYDYRPSENWLFSAYFAPMGDPAMGPVAYPHRASASENALAPLGHHLEDSTHIVSDVLTVGVTYRAVRIEASGFHGREPDEHRWNIDPGKLDSWSTRATFAPGQNWAMQYSLAQLHSPEAAAAQNDIRRMTASVSYNRPIRDGNWSSMALWGRNQSLLDGNIGNSYLLESTLKFLNKNYAWTRIENADRTNELLLGENLPPPGFSEKYFTRVQAYTAGYDREVGRIPHLLTALGGQFTWYGVPVVLRPSYGTHPVAAVLFLRMRIH